MRDPARIERILELIGEAWRQNPDLRLGQLVVNAAPIAEPLPGLFYLEDSVLEDRLRAQLLTAGRK